MSDLNKAQIIGRLGADPEKRLMPSSGKAFTNIRVATSERWKKDGEQQERTEWHSVVMFDKLAEIAAQYLRKGSQVYIEGSLRTRKWKDKEGNDRYSTEIVAHTMQMLGGKPEGAREAQREQVPGPKTDEGFSDEIPFIFAFAVPVATLLASMVFGFGGMVA